MSKSKDADSGESNSVWVTLPPGGKTRGWGSWQQTYASNAPLIE